MTILVTGAAGGIGRAAYDALATGWPDKAVFGHDLDAKTNTGLHFTGDLAHPKTLDVLQERVLQQGSLDAVVVAHGVAGAGALHEIHREDVARIMAINFETVVALWERFGTYLERTEGVFVVIASQASLISEAGNGVYSASKSALAGWLRGLDGRTAARLRLLHPGATRTPLLESALRGIATARSVSYEQVLAERGAATPAGRLGEPDDIGAAVLWSTQLQASALVEIPITGGEVRW